MTDRVADVDAEEARATQAEATLTSNLAQEVTDRVADVDAEEQRATNAEDALGASINAEANRAMDAEAANRSLINSNSDDIAVNRNHLSRLDNEVDMLRSGVAMSMALAGMPTGGSDGMNFALGLGNFGGKSAVAIGFTRKTATTSYKLGITHASGETGVSAGMSFKLD